MEFLRANQLDLMLLLSGSCCALSLLVIFSKAIPFNRRMALLLLELSCVVLLLSDRFAYIYRGDVSHKGYIMVRVCNFLVFAFSLLIQFSFTWVLKNLYRTVNYPNKINRNTLRICDLLFILGEALVLISQFTGFYYVFDAYNRYERSNGIAVSYVISTLIMLLQLFFIIRNKRNLSIKMFVTLIAFTVVPLIATIAQIFLYGLSLTNISVVGMAVLLYVFTLLDINEQIEDAKIKEINMLKSEQEKMQMMFEQTSKALASAIDAKDEYTHGHSRRVAKYSELIAKNSGKSIEECQRVYYAALLHDVGKIGIPDYIINKAGKLTKEEYEIIKQHTSIGSQILSSISSTPYLSLGARYHHERYDGNGYPEGLSGKNIPEIARIIAVADAYDTMTSKRSYRAPLAKQLVREEIIKGSGTQFDPEFARIMIFLMDLDKDFKMHEPDALYLVGNKEA